MSQILVSVNGPLIEVIETFINPYDASEIDVNGMYSTHGAFAQAGSPAFLDVITGNNNNQLIRLEDSEGNVLIESFEIIQPGRGDDIILFASLTTILGNLEIQAGDGNDIVWSNAGNDLIVGGQGEDILHGGPGNDNMFGGTENDTVIGGSGDDKISGDAGNDFLFGGSGDDDYRFESGDGIDTILETSGFDQIVFGNGISFGDLIITQNGDDLEINYAGKIIITNFFSGNRDFVVEEIVFKDGSTYDLVQLLPPDILFVGTPILEDFVGAGGSDTVDYSTSETRIKVDLEAGTGTDGDATGDTFVSIENIIGSDLSTSGDFIYGNDGFNTLQGLGGRDVLEGGAGADIIDGGVEFDYARYTRSDEAVDIDLTRATQIGGHAQGDELISIENVTGSDYDDTLIGDEGRNTLRGGNGNDTLGGGLGNDMLFGDRGNDTFLYTGGVDLYNDRDNGFERVIFDAVWSASDVIISGNQLSFLNNIENEITFNDITLFEEFVFGSTAYTLAALQALSTPTGETGNASDDTFLATLIAEDFVGGEGEDTVDYSDSTTRVKVDLETETGTDGFAAGDTFDSIENIRGANLSTSGDFIYGDGGVNFIEGLGGRDILEGGAGADIIDGGEKEDYARYTRSDAAVDIDLTRTTQIGGDAEGDELISIENVTGSAFNDKISGDEFRNTLRGENGNDDLFGGGHSDILYGGRDDDILNGGASSDDLYGQSGADTFLFDGATAFTGIDKIRDFSLDDGDKIDISDVLIGYESATNAISDFVQITNSGDNSILSIDADGGGNNFIQISTILGVTDLTNEDFLEATGTLIA